MSIIESEVIETPLSPEVVARNADMEVRYDEMTEIFYQKDSNKWDN